MKSEYILFCYYKQKRADNCFFCFLTVKIMDLSKNHDFIWLADANSKLDDIDSAELILEVCLL